jgi:hypothetical protein
LPSNPFGQSNTGAYFASLYSLTRQNRQAVQNAADQDAFDQWSNGLMDDQTWLAYIATRIAATAADPTAHEKWVTAQRKYTSQIADGQAEFAYKNGGTVGDLIVYYTSKLGGLNSGSQEYRSVQLRLNDLMDTRAANDITDGSQKLADQIAAGTATYDDLLRFYRDHLSALRPSSALYQQVTGEIEKINQTIATNKLNGDFERLQYQYESKQITGKSYAATLRSMAVQFQVNDPQKYYQILEAATKLDAAPGLYGTGGGGGGGSAAVRAIDALQAQTIGLYQLIDQYDAGNATGIDRSGQPVTFTPETVKSIDNQIVNSLNATGAVYDAQGNHSAAADAYLRASQYITGTGQGSPGRMQLHNTVAVEDQAQALFLASTKLLAAARQDPNPNVLTSAGQTVAANYAAFVQGLTTQASGGTLSGQSLGGGALLSQRNMATPQEIARQAAIATALEQSVNGVVNGLTDAQGIAILDTLSAAFPNGQDPYLPSAKFTALRDQLIAPAALGPAIEQGLLDKSVVEIATPNGFVFVPTIVQMVTTSLPSPDGLMMHDAVVPVRIPVAPEGSSLGKAGQPIQGLTDIVVTVAGQLVHMQGLLVPQASPMNAYFAVSQFWSDAVGDNIGKGQIDQTDVTEMLAAGELEQNIALGHVELRPAFVYNTLTVPAWTDSSGVSHPGGTASQDPDTGAWYMGPLPIRGAQRVEGTNPADNIIKWDATTGKWAIDWASYSTAAGTQMPFFGDDAPAMQAWALAHPELFPTWAKWRDATGTPVLAPPDAFKYQYYDVTMDTRSEAANIAHDSWWSSAERQSRADALLMRDQLAARTSTMATTASTDPVLKGISDLAATLGIHLGFAPPANIDLFAPKTSAPATGWNNYDTRSEANAALLPAGLRSVLPTSSFDPTALQTYTGPDITGTVAPKIDSVLPASAPVITIPQPPAVYAPPAARIYEPAPPVSAPVVQLRNPQIYPYPTRESM